MRILNRGWSRYKAYRQKQRDKKAAKPKKSLLREWWDAIKFAAIAALIIRTFIIEAYMIPTSSMESTMMIGDFLFVSKFHYGPRMPMAPLSIPFVHNTIPFTTNKSFLDVELPYWRLTTGRVDRNDVVVFNYPADDYLANNLMWTVDIPSLKENYIKRCVALPGDEFYLKNGEVFINGQPGWVPPERQVEYEVRAAVPLDKTAMAKLALRGPCAPVGDEECFKKANVKLKAVQNDTLTYEVHCTHRQAEELKTYAGILQVKRVLRPEGFLEPGIFPHEPAENHRVRLMGNGQTDPYYFQDHPAHNVDWWGPVTVPAEGATVALTRQNIAIYRRIIKEYEDHELQERGDGTFLIDGAPATSYTFEMDYYFMMGDNRHQSLDGRYWGFVPRDHIVGYPWFVLFSFEGGIRWNRLFKSIH